MDSHINPKTPGRQRKELHSSHDGDSGAPRSPAIDIDAAMQFIGDVFGTQEWPGRLSIVTIDARQKVVSQWYESLDAVAHGWRTHATKWAQVHVYCGMAMTTPDVDDRLLTPHNRLISNPEDGKPSAGGIPGLWADLDFGEDHNSKHEYPSDEAHVCSLLASLPQPTLIVHSGHGLQAYWLFEEFLPTLTPEELAMAEELLDDWKRRVKKAFAPFYVDSVFDLARIMRLPGTINHKAVPVAVRVLSSDGPRYTPQFFASLPPLEPKAPEPKKKTSRTRGSISFNRAAEAPPDLLEVMLAEHEKFRLTWGRNRPDLVDQSASGYDLALASICAGFEAWTDQHITDLLIQHRRCHGDDLKRGDYYARTVARARRPIKTTGTVKAGPGDVEAGQQSDAGTSGSYAGKPSDSQLFEEKALLVSWNYQGWQRAVAAAGWGFYEDTRSDKVLLRTAPGDLWRPQGRTSVAWFREHVAEHVIALKGGSPQSFRPSQEDFHQYILAEAHDNRRDAFMMYLDGGTVWDKVDRVRTMLPTLFGMPDDDLTLAAAYLILGVPVYRTLNPGAKSDVVPVLQGPGNTGKSTLLRELFPPEMQGWWYGRVLMSMSEKERLEAIQGKVLVEWGEMEGAGRSIDKLFGWITETDDNSIRKAHRWDPTSNPRLFGVVGTSHRDSPLPNDPNTRRFLVRSGTHGYNIEEWCHENRAQLWAQVFAEVQAGRDPRFPRDLLEQQALENDRYRDKDVVLESAIEELERSNPEACRAGLKISEVIQAIHNRSLVDATDAVAAVSYANRRVSTALRARGWTWSRCHRGDLYSKAV